MKVAFSISQEKVDFSKPDTLWKQLFHSVPLPGLEVNGKVICISTEVYNGGA